MKIVTRTELRQLPRGAIFSYFKPCSCKGLMQFGGNIENDFYVRDFIPGYDQEAGPDKAVLSMAWQREGLFEDAQLFAVYEWDDIRQLVQACFLFVNETRIPGRYPTEELYHQALINLVTFFGDDPNWPKLPKP